MAKSDNERLAERLAEIQDLLQQKAKIEDRLKHLTGIKQEEKKTGTPKPDGFSLMDTIKSVLAEQGRPLTPTAINAAIGLQFNYEPDVKTTRATAKYMVKKGILKMNDDKTFSLMF